MLKTVKFSSLNSRLFYLCIIMVSWVVLFLPLSTIVDLFPPVEGFGGKLFWEPNLQLKKTAGPLETIEIAVGEIDFINNCDDLPRPARTDDDEKEKNDYILASADIYIIPHRSYERAIGAPPVRYGLEDVTSENTITTFALTRTFEHFPIGSTTRIGNDDYDIIYDECQNRALDGEDELFANALTVNIPMDYKMTRVAKSLQEQIKRKDIATVIGIDSLILHINLIYYSWKIGKLLKDLHKGEELTKQITKRSIEFSSKMAKDDVGFPFVIPTSILGLGKDVTIAFLEKLKASYIQHAVDPPRLDFMQASEMSQRTAVDIPIHVPVVDGLTKYTNEVSNEEALSNALLDSLESFQGAQVDGEVRWGLIHADNIMKYSKLLANQLSYSNNALNEIKIAISDIPSLDSNLSEIQSTFDGILDSGFTSAAVREFKNMNFSDSDISAVNDALSSIDFSIRKTQLVDSLDNLADKNNALRNDLQSFSSAMNDTIFSILAEPLNNNIDIPKVSLQADYVGMVGIPVEFNGSKSDTENSTIVHYEWDMDSDGKFDDSTSSSHSFTYLRPFHGYVGLRVTDDRGFSNVGYAPITITNDNTAPVIVSSAPETSTVDITVGNATSFSIVGSDPDGDDVETEWLVDGIIRAEGTSFIYDPLQQDFGLHSIQAKVRDNKNATNVEEWLVIVLMPDIDKDGWNANADCNDTNPNINPGMREIFYNGVDDDCNPASIDTNSPPVANNQTLVISQFAATDIILTGNDVDGYPLNFTITNLPKNGTLSNITIVDPTNARLTYSPTSNFHGEDIFGFTVNDGNYTSNPASVNITVLIQDPPIAKDQNLNIDEDTTKEIFLTSSSPDGHQLNFSIASKPNGGKLSNITSINSTTAKVTYTPFQDFNSNATGNDFFTFKVNDGIDPSRRGESQALIQIAINPINDAPRSFDQIVTTKEDIPIDVILRANDPENDLTINDHHNHGLNFSIVDSPTHGTLSEIKHIDCTDCASGPTIPVNSTDDWVTYTPNIGFAGQDQFTFVAGDGNLNGNESKVTINVKPSNSSLPVEFEVGDIFIPSIDQIQWRNPDGTLNGLLEPISAGIGRIQKGGAFDSAGNLYITEYNGGIVSKFNKTGGLVGPFGDYVKDYECVPSSNNGSPVCEFWPLSITFDKQDNAYISGQVFPPTTDAMDDIRKFDSNGNLIQKFDADIENVEQGIHWIELGSDQCTLYYATANDHIKRFDVCTNKQLSDFADLFTDPSYDRRFGHQPILVIRLLPNGEMLVAQNSFIHHLDTSGKIKMTYDITGSSNWISLALDPDKQSFWAGATGNGTKGNVYKFDIDSGKVLRFFNTFIDNPFALPTPEGLIIKGEPQPGATNIAPLVENQTVLANINVPIAINLTASDVSNDPLTFSITSIPSFGTVSPIVKINDNMSMVTYSPNQNSDSPDSFTFNANDGFQNSSIMGKIDILMNHPPLASDDLIITIEGNSTNIPVLANDTDEDSNKLSITSVNTSSALGDVIVNNHNGTITYTPFLTFTGQDTFNYTISDGRGGDDSAQVRINIKSLNDPPVADAQSATTSKNLPINITLTGSDPNGDSLSFSAFSGPTNGHIIKLNSTTGILQYAPLSYYHGNDSFSFRVSDGKTKSVPATVNITITDNGVNDPPNAVSERTFTERNKPVIINVLSNDGDPNGDPLTIANITGPINGTAFLNENETITFTPFLNFNGSDVFFYNVTDGKGGSDIAQVIVDVRGPSGNAPTVQDQILSTNKNTPLNVTLTGTSPSGSALTFSVLKKSTHGNLSGIIPINNTAAKLVYTSTINFTGRDLFTFKANNGTVDSNIGTVAIVVNGTNATNTSPIARDDLAIANEDKPILITVLANDTDTDGDLLSLDSIQLQPINGSSIINSNGTVTYSPNTNFFGSDAFNYTITDGKGGNASAHVSVTVNSVNDPPVATNDIATTLQDKPVVINVLANDTDPEGDALVISAITNPPSNGTTIINNNRTITFSAPTGFSGSDTFDYQVSDGNDGNSTGSVLVNVIAAVNKSPVVSISSPINGSQFTEGDPVAFSGSTIDPEDGNISSVMKWESSIDGPLGIGPNIVTSSLSQGTHSITASAIDSGELSNSSRIEIIVNDFDEPPIAVADHFEINEDTPLNMNVIANDTDPENDALTIADVNPGPNNGQASINNNNTINFIPNQNFNGQDSLTYTVTDGLGGNSSAQVIVDILPVNDDPIAQNDSTATDKNNAALIDVLTNDTDVDNDPLTISQVTKPAHGTASIENSKIKYTPNLNFVGSDEFDYTVSDGNGGNSKASVTVNVKSVNQLPVATDGSVNTDENTPLNMKLNASDPDNDPLTYVLDTQPTHGYVSGFDANNGTLTYTPQVNFTGQDSLKFKVNDGTANSNIATVLINVKNVNHSPVAENQNVITNTNKQIEITLKGHDPDSDIISFVKVTDPSHGAIAGFDKDTGKLTYIPNNGFSGPDNFLFKVVDSDGVESNVASVSITVNAVANKPPGASNLNVETSQDTANVITLLGTDPDSGDKVTYLIVSPASSGFLSSIDQATGKITYTPDKGFLGLDSFTYKVTDLSGASSNIATVGISVRSTTPTPYPLPPACSPNDKSGGKALKGSSSDDVIVGTRAGDSIEGLSGNDAINGCGSADNLNGNNGNDGIAGGTTGDNIHGNNGNDYLRGDAGDDGLYGGEGDDVFVGGPGRDSFYCGSGNDKVIDFNANEGDRLQKDLTTRDRDPNKKHDCENVSTASSTSVSAKSSSQELPSTSNGQVPSSDSGNQTQAKPSQLQQLQPSTKTGQNETIKVAPNNSPTVNDYTINMDKNNRISITLHGSDSDGDKLTFKIIDNSQNGLIKDFKSSGSLTYTPKKDYVGVDQFTFVASDRKSTRNLGIVTIHVEDKQTVTDQQQSELQLFEKQADPFPLIYWRGNIEKTGKLLPLTIGNLTVDSAEEVNSVLRLSADNHNIYDNTAAQVLIAKLNIKNEVNSCGKVNEALKYGDGVLKSVNYEGIGTVSQELSNTIMKNIIKAHTALSRFNTHGCSATVPTDFYLVPNIFDIMFTGPLGSFLN